MEKVGDQLKVSKIMKPFVYLLLEIFFGLVLNSCSSDEMKEMISIDYSTEPSGDAISILKDNQTGVFYRYQKDPFCLSNMQEAYNHLVKTDESTKASSFVSGYRLLPTHYALKVYPKTLKEVSNIERIDDIKVSYHPFNCVPVSGKDSLISMGNYELLEKSPYTVGIEDDNPVDGIGELNELLIMPIQYVVWPIDKELPDDYEYVIDYEVFIPEIGLKTKSTNSGLSKEDIFRLEDEALYLATGKRMFKPHLDLNSKELREEDDSSNFKVMSGYVTCYDSTRQAMVPVEGLTMRFELGTFILDAHTVSNGYYDITLDTEYHPYLNFSFYFKSHDYFYITLNYSNTVFQDCYGTVSNVFGTDMYCEHDFCLTEISPILQTFRGARWYFAGNHGIPIPDDTTTPIRINVRTTIGDNGDGIFHVDENNLYITIYSKDCSFHAYKIGVVLHELGHYHHYVLKGEQTSQFYLLPGIVRESFASYIGWMMDKSYYTHIGYTSSYLLTGQDHQDWTINMSAPGGRYSPLFVDLYDTENQGLFDTDKPNDNISGTPYSAIKQVIIQGTNWSSVRQILSSYIYTYYSSSDFNTFIASFDNWISNNSNDL